MPTKIIRQAPLVAALVAAACGGRDAGVEERLAHRLLDELDRARVELGSPPDAEAAAERVVLAARAGDGLGSAWVAFDSGGRPPRAELHGDQLHLLDSACAIVAAGPSQIYELAATMAAVPRPGEAGREMIELAGEPFAVELDERPRSAAEGCQAAFFVNHGLRLRQSEPPGEPPADLPHRRSEFATMSQTRALAVVLPTRILVSFGVTVQVTQQSGSEARLGEVRLARRGIQGVTRAQFLETFPPDPLLPGDPHGILVKPDLAGQLRDAALAPPGTTLCWSAELPERAALRFSMGVAWDLSSAAARPVRFEVRAGDRVLHREEIGSGQAGWRDRRVDLTGLAGPQELCFATQADEGDGALWSVWGSPEITSLAAADEAGPRTIVLVSVDTLRADRLGLYGFDAPTSPVLDRFADEAVVFDGAVAQTGWTLPSHVSMLTGLSPEAHGVTGQMDHVLDVLDVGFDPSIPTLASALRQAGYSTHAIVSAPYLEPAFGFGRGFDSYDVSTISSHLRADSDVAAPRVERLAGELLGRSGRRPLFLFLHFWDPHYDYIPAQEDLSAVHPELGAKRLDYAQTHLFAWQGDPAWHHLGRAAGPQSPLSAFYRKVRSLLPHYPRIQGFVRVQSELYDGEIRGVDRHFGSLLRNLARLKRGDAIVAVTSDHGESFMEHGTLCHGGDNIHAEGLIVPLLLRAPGRLRPGRRAAAAMTVDVPATILDLAGLEGLRGAQGRSLLRPAAGERMVVGHDGEFTRVRAALGPHRLLVWGAFKEDQLFDVSRDPGELVDLGEAMPDRRAELRRALARYLLEHGRGLHVAITGDQRTQPVEVAIEADVPLRPAFAYGPPNSGTLTWAHDRRSLRFQVIPTTGELIALTVLLPDDAVVRSSVSVAGAPAPLERILGPRNAPLTSLVSDASWLLPADAVPEAALERPGVIVLWRTPAFTVRAPLAPQQETLDQLRALGYIRDE